VDKIEYQKIEGILRNNPVQVVKKKEQGQIFFPLLLHLIYVVTSNVVASRPVVDYAPKQKRKPVRERILFPLAGL
jgi:hypothetical protein